jgi:hypothetical protein
MDGMRTVDVLRGQGTIAWTEEHRAWVASPKEVVGLLTNQGFAEYKREQIRTRSGEVAAGLWEGLDLRTGALASAIWV